METQDVQKPLENALNNHKTASAKKFTTDKRQVYAEGLKVLKESKIVDNALQVGDTAFNFELPNATGKNITLYNELKKSAVILM